MRSRYFALYAVVALTLLAVGPGLVAAAEDGSGDAGFAVAVTQPAGEEPTVSVTNNETAVENASVTVETVDNVSYAGTGSYTTDGSGTVGLSAPEMTVDIEVSAAIDNHTASATATLTAVNVSDANETDANETDANETDDGETDANETDDGEMSFGNEVATFIDALLEHRNASTEVGPAVSSFVVANNPGNAPDHAGPPADVGDNETDEDDNETRGPPADAGPPEDKTRGPPADADNENETRGPPADSADDNETDNGDEIGEDSDDEIGEDSDDADEEREGAEKEESEDAEEEREDAEEDSEDAEEAESNEDDDEETDETEENDDADDSEPPASAGPPSDVPRGSN